VVAALQSANHARPAAAGAPARTVRRTRHAAPPESAGTPPAADSDEARVVRALTATPRTLDALAQDAGLEPDQVLAALIGLEWSGMVQAVPGARWRVAR